MAKQLLTINRFNAGISDSEKQGPLGSFFFAQNLDIFSEPSRVSINPKTIKDSGATVVDLVKWIVSGTPYDTNTYFYGSAGNIYKRTSAGAWSNLRTVTNSVGQGMDLYGGTAGSQNYLIYTQNTQVGRYGPLDGAAAFTDNWQTGLNDTSTTKFAPVKSFQSGVAVGHGNNLGWFDGTVWTANKLTLPPGFQIRALEIIDEFLAIAAWKGTSITSSEESYIFFWDGSATTYNFFVRSDDGAVNALLNSQNRLISVVGSSGAIFEGYAPFSQVSNFPKIKFANKMEVYPGAVTNWKNFAHLGAAGSTDSTDLYQGVYQLGSKTSKYPEALNFAYTLSTGETTGTVMAIGACKGIGNQFFVSWEKSDATFGVDRILQTNAPFASGSIEFLIFDAGTPMMEKLSDTFKASILPLATGESVQIGYKVDRATSYSTPQAADTTVGDVTVKFPIRAQDSRFHEIQMEVILNASATTTPKLTGMSLKYDDLIESVSTGKGGVH